MAGALAAISLSTRSKRAGQAKDGISSGRRDPQGCGEGVAQPIRRMSRKSRCGEPMRVAWHQVGESDPAGESIVAAGLGVLHDRQARAALFRLDLFPAAAQFADRVGREDVDLLFAELGFAALRPWPGTCGTLRAARSRICFFGDVGDLLALDVDDARGGRRRRWRRRRLRIRRGRSRRSP